MTFGIPSGDPRCCERFVGARRLPMPPMRRWLNSRNAGVPMNMAVCLGETCGPKGNELTGVIRVAI